MASAEVRISHLDLGGLEQAVKLRIGCISVERRVERLERFLRLIQLQAHARQQLARLQVVGGLLQNLFELGLRLVEVALGELRTSEQQAGGQEVRHSLDYALQIRDALRSLPAGELETRTEKH